MNGEGRFQALALFLLLFLIFGLVSLAVSQVKTLETDFGKGPPSHQLSRHSSDENTHAYQDRKSPRISFPPSPSAKPDHLYETTEASPQSSNKEEEPKWTDKVVAWFTVILTVSTIGLWYFASVQSSDMKNSLLIAEQAANAAADAAKASDKQARIAEETAERQLRAYVTVKGGDLIFKDQTIFCVLTIENAGQTPAYDLTTWTNIGVQPSGNPFGLKTMLPDSAPGKVILGSGSVIHPRVRFDVPPEHNDMIPAVQGGLATIYIWGCINYVDIFRQARFVEFRLRSFQADQQTFIFEATPEGNHAN